MNLVLCGISTGSKGCREGVQLSAAAFEASQVPRLAVFLFICFNAIDPHV